MSNSNQASALPDPINQSTRLKTDLRETRCLTLFPGSYSDPIECKLEVVSLDSKTEYEVISYVWGDGDQNGVITIDNAPVTVTANLEHALWHLRRSNTKRKLWVDAVCIDQKNEEERSYQVALIRDVYQLCKGVLVWLGDASDPTGAPFGTREPEEVCEWGDPSEARLKDTNRLRFYKDERLQCRTTPPAQIHKKVQDYQAVAFCILYMLASGGCIHDIPFLKAGLFRQRTIEALVSIMGTSWWKRLWVIPETVFAPMVTMYYGRFRAPWSMFTMAAKAYEKCRIQLCCMGQLTHIESDSLGGLSQYTKKVLELDEVKEMWSNGEIRSLCPLLRRFRSRTTTDPRDKVYALLALLDHWDRRPALLPNYSLSVPQIYRVVVRELIETHKTLTPLLGNTNKDETNDMASWIPDWSVMPHPYEFERLARESHYDAAKGVPANTKLFGQLYLLSDGFSYDRITQVGECMPLKDERDCEKVFADWSALADIDNPSHPRYPTGESMAVAYCRTLCMDTVYAANDSELPFRAGNYKRVSTDYVEKFEGYWSSLPEVESEPPTEERDPTPLDTSPRQSLKRPATFWNNTAPEYKDSSKRRKVRVSRSAAINDEDTARFPRKLLERKDTDNYTKLFDRSTLTATTHRKFFRTEKGYMGLGHAEIQKDDEIFVLAGGLMPFVLRPVGKKEVEREGLQLCHKVVGECFVHGIMYGQAMDDPNSKMGQVFLV